jgi:hypothetical protein
VPDVTAALVNLKTGEELPFAGCAEARRHQDAQPVPWDWRVAAGYTVGEARAAVPGAGDEFWEACGRDVARSLLKEIDRLEAELRAARAAV